MKNIGQIIKDYLIKNGYSGLQSEGSECGCHINDMAPCGEDCTVCFPGHIVENKSCEHIFSSKKPDINK